MSVQISATAHAQRSMFPFVTVMTFESMGQAAKSQSGIETITYAPLIQPGEVKQWESYSVEHQDWIAESRYTALLAAENSLALSVTPSDYQDGSIFNMVYDLAPENSSLPVISSLENDGGFGPYVRK